MHKLTPVIFYKLVSQSQRYLFNANPTNPNSNNKWYPNHTNPTTKYLCE